MAVVEEWGGGGVGKEVKPVNICTGLLLGKCRPFRVARLWCGLWAKVSLRTGWSGYRTLSSLVNSGRQCPIDIPTTLESLVWSELDWGDW